MSNPITAEEAQAAEKQTFDVADPYHGLSSCKFDDLVPAGEADDAELDFHVYKPIASAGITPTYIKDYFVANPEKPQVNVPVVTGTGSLYGSIVGHISEVTVQEASAYILECMTLFKATPGAEWTSYGVVLGTAGVEITPRALFNANPDSTLGRYETGPQENITNSQRIYLLMWLLAPYRIHQGIRQEYTQALVTRITDNMKEFKRPAMGDLSLMAFVKMRPTWEQNITYSRLAAVIDMFISKFPEIEFGRTRVCTVSARFKDCAALTGIEYLRALLDVQFGELMAWIWTPSVAKDLRQVFRPDEELSKNDSYLPYLSSMKLVAKSPYSATHNTSLHFWIHFTAALMGQTRSNHARFIGGTNTVVTNVTLCSNQ